MRVRSSGRFASAVSAAVLSAAVLSAAALGFAAPANAEDPVALDGAYVLDRAGVLGDRADEVQQAVDDLYDETGIQLFVVYVDSFTGAADAPAWANATAERNSLGQNDLLLAIATEDRNFATSAAEDFRLSDAQLADVESGALLPALRSDDWAGAAVAAAEGYAAEARPAPNLWPILLGLLVVAGLALAVFLVVRARRKGKAAENAAEDLDRRASVLLVQLDDAVRTSEQELGFAVAQFGEAATRDFATALTSARAKLREAFEIRQRLDDAFPESEEEQASWTGRIVELCTAADAELDAQADAFDELRDLEQNAPAVLEQVSAAHTAAAARIPEATSRIEGLRPRYAPDALAPIDDNPERAEKLLGLAATALDSAREGIATGSTGTAVVVLRAAQAETAQAVQLLDAVEARGTELAAASERLTAAVADLRQDVAQARTLPASEPLAAAVTNAETAIASAAGDRIDPITRLMEVERASAGLDTSLATARTQQERAQRAAASLDRAIASARAQIEAASSYVTTRRGAVSGTARTRLAEAERHLFIAVSQFTLDPVRALTEADRANRLADEAMAYAQSDTAVFTGPAGIGYRQSSGGGLEGAVLGGLLGYLAGGSRSTGGIFGGGGPWASPRRRGGGLSGGFGGGGGLGGGFGGISRGGGGMRSSRGGGFGGSRRSRGGRF